MTALLTLHRDDDVALATEDLVAGRPVRDGLVARDDVPRGHKVALRDLPAGTPVRKYGQVIGFTTRPVAAGEHVHTHNLGFQIFDREYEYGVAARPEERVPAGERATFDGIVRSDGRVATRNHIGVLTAGGHSVTVARRIAERFRRQEGLPGLLDAYPAVDGVVALPHALGDGTAGEHGEEAAVLRRTLTGYARHPNFAGFLVLGREAGRVRSLAEEWGVGADTPVVAMALQESGGTRAAVAEGVARITDLLPAANTVSRRPVPASELVLAMECGGSDGYSGITANPALGAAADLLIRHGGTAVFGETPEIYGAEHLLVRRAVSRAVGEKLVRRVRWWEEYTARHGGSMDNNPSPGNKAGGLTTILEKSLGAAAKGGQSNLADVVEYAEPVTAKGLVFMDTPGYDPVNATGMVAGGAHVLCFTTGRGSVFGCKPAPSLKLATNTPLYERMTDDMDLNCGLIADGECDVAEMGRRIFDLVLATASGRRTRSEELGFGDEEFVPWRLGTVR
ncbi:UxaA family hydrolase [Actinoallomurus rhizosphaericola]|uniref:UxaA family hydrolase n=1 Tax=Actinoallomurus rhizosphaericola TaxID=2952536 RepID=UPI002093ECD0|nr:altronate dehydratase family protein [Actinoallomurus rhizosphaericola]MCO5997190.1 altronate dehydratase family protein [Actinoallomurus rhizosphaericola]